MKNHCQGFSLIEALIAVLVVSVGFLGLGQLQVRLTERSGDLHTLGSARLFSLSLYELRQSGWHAYSTAASARLRPGFGEKLNLNTTLKTSQGVNTALLSVTWQRPAGAHGLQLISVEDPDIRWADSRWLTHLP